MTMSLSKLGICARISQEWHLIGGRSLKSLRRIENPGLTHQAIANPHLDQLRRK
jgi:hypothetical protein